MSKYLWMPWNFLWKSPGLPRPPDPLSDTLRFQVYNVTEEEAKQHHIVAASNKKSEEPLLYLCTTKIKGKDSYEIILKKDKNRYSLTRSLRKTEAVDIYNRLKNLVISLIPYGPKGGKLPEVAAFLQELVLFSNKHKEFGVVHLAARMGLQQPFYLKVPLYVSKINEPIQPLNATPLILSVLSGREEAVSAILLLGPNLKILDSNNSSALHYAASSSNPQILTLVLNQYYKNFGFEFLRKKNKYGLTPFHLSCYSDQRTNTIQFLELKLPIDILNASRPARLYHVTEGVKSKSRESATLLSAEEQKRQQETRVTFTRQMMEDLEWSEIKLGGTPLHWVTRRRTLDVLLQYQFPKESLNFNQESVIHVMIRRKRLRCLIILLSNGYSPNLEARRRLTPLHYAILDESGASDVTLVQLLAVFDADLNAPAYNQTARHMTQNILDPDAKDVVLYILHTLGAKRCERKIEKTNERKECYDGCIPGGKNDGRPYKGWPPLEGQAMYTKYLIEDIVKRVRQKPHGQKRINMLCCDGGGTRGILAAQMLIELQKYLRKPLHEYFDWLCGTSTGSFIASYLAIKRTPEDIRRHYVTLKDNIFAGERPYSTTVVEKFLKNVIPEWIKMGDIKDKHLIITAVQADCSPVQLHLFRNYPAPDEIATSSRSPIVPFDKQPQNSSDVPLWFACRASGAAPSYFRPAKVYIDGGLIANNPTLDTMTEFFMYNKALESVGRKSETQILGSVLSLGTGRWPIVHQEPLNVGRMTMRAPRQSYNQAIALVTTLSIVSSMTDNYIVDRAQSWCSTLNIPYFRLSPPISEQLPLDVKNDSELVNAMYETKAYCHHLKDDFKQLASVLEDSLDTHSSPTSNSNSNSSARVVRSTVSPNNKK